MVTELAALGAVSSNTLEVLVHPSLEKVVQYMGCAKNVVEGSGTMFHMWDTSPNIELQVFPAYAAGFHHNEKEHSPSCKRGSWGRHQNRTVIHGWHRSGYKDQKDWIMSDHQVYAMLTSTGVEMVICT